MQRRADPGFMLRLRMGLVGFAFVFVVGCSGGDGSDGSDAFGGPSTTTSPSAPATANGARTNTDDPKPADPSERIVGRDCKRSVCDEMQAHRSALCSECHSIAMGSSDFMGTYSSCGSVCAAPICTDDDRRLCASESAPAPQKPPPSEQDLELACYGAAASTFLCGAKIDCDEVLRVMRPEATSYFECLDHGIGCEEKAACKLPPSTYGDELGDALDARCPGKGISTEDRAHLNRVAGGFKDDVLARGRDCLTRESCDAVARCLSVWP